MWGTLDSRLKDPGFRAVLGCFMLEKPEVIATIDEPPVSDWFGRVRPENIVFFSVYYPKLLNLRY